MRKFIAVALCIFLSSPVFTQTQTSAVKNSFQQVTSHLDSGGNLYLYLSTEEWFTGLSAQLSQFRDFLDALPGSSAADKQNGEQVLGFLSNLVKHSGIEEISGFGMSSIAVEKGLYRSKSILHHYKGNDTGFLWSMFGKQPHALTGLELLPANTAFAAFYDLDFPLLWSVINKELGQSGIPDAQRSIQAFRAQFGAMTGVDLAKVIASIGSECGLVITLDEMKTPNPRLPGPAGQMPDVGLMLACQVKNDTIFDMLDSTMKANSQVLRKDKGGLRMRTMPSPMPMPINLRPSFARSGDYFFAATTDSLIETALAVKAGTQLGLKSTDEFKKLSQGIRSEGNSFVFRSGRIAETFARMQSQVMGGNIDPSRTQVLTTLFGSPGTPGTYHVAVNTDEGWLASGNSGQNPAAAFFLLPTVAFTAIVASAAIPSLLRSRQAANETAAVATLRTIATAEVTYMAVSRGGYGNMQALIQAGLLDPRITSSVSGYQFTIEVFGNNYTATATPESPNSGRYSYFVTREGVVRYSRVPTQAPPGESGNPVQ